MNKILIVDDATSNVILLKERLLKEGFEVISAPNGKTGIQQAIDYKPDLILLDIIMPDISGIEVCKNLSADPRTFSIPIILISAKISPEDIENGFQAGAFDYIKKPIDLMEMVTRVKSAIRFRYAQAALIENARFKTFAATVVTANHKIKQPLTIISLSVSALKREVGKEEISREAIIKRIDYIEKATSEITSILNQLNTMERPKIAEYLRDIKMVDMDTKESVSN
jgi:two-component system cell cycle response regulator